MLSVLMEAALRSAVIALTVWVLLRLLRIHDVQVQSGAWRMVLISAIAMPLLMQWQTLTLPAPTLAIMPLDAVDVVGAAQASGPSVLLWIYCAGASVLFLRLCFGLWRMYRIVVCAQLIAMHGHVATRRSDAVASPVTFGRSILVPKDFDAWHGIKQQAVIAHERAHVMHGDFWFSMLAQVHRCVFWFSPLAWWLPHRLSMLSEQRSDDVAIACIGDRAAYAGILLELSSAPRDPTAVAMARPQMLIARVERLLAQSQIDTPLSRSRRSLLMLPVLSIIAAAAGCSPEKETQQTTSAQKPAPVSPAPEADAPTTSMRGDPPVSVEPPPNTQWPKSNPALPLSQRKYPGDARRARQHGTVVLNLYVSAGGGVEEARVKKSSGFPSLDEAAANESMNWRLDPGTVNGKPAPMWGTFAVTFKLRD